MLVNIFFTEKKWRKLNEFNYRFVKKK